MENLGPSSKTVETTVADGWVYGAEKNAELKTHPCLVPYGDLPVEQRVKDELFTAIVKAVSEAIES